MDFLIVDYVKEYLLDSSIAGDTLITLKQLIGKIWLEVAAYLEEPRIVSLHPLLLILEGSNVPLHVFIRKHKGGGPVRDLYKHLSKQLIYVYIHNDLYPYLDTLCPKCKAPLATRDEGILRVLEINDGKCWKCGAPVDFIKPVNKRTPIQLTLTAREGGVVWYHPSQLVGREF